MIAVLPVDCPEDTLSALLSDLERRGWTSGVSRGAEQIVLAVAGPERREELVELLGSRVDADVIELLPRRRYRRLLRRRRLYHGIVGGLGLLVAFGMGIPAVILLRPPAAPRNTPELVRAGSVAELGPFESKLLRLPEGPVLVVRLAGERLYALDASCPHMDACGLEWSRERFLITCPCHGCAFDVYGNVVNGPASVPLPSHEVELRGGEVLVHR